MQKQGTKDFACIPISFFMKNLRDLNPIAQENYFDETHFTSALLFFIVSFSSAQNKPANLNKADAAWLSNAQAYILKNEYYFKSTSSSFSCANRKQNVIYTVSSNGYTLTPIINQNKDEATIHCKAFKIIIKINCCTY